MASGRENSLANLERGYWKDRSLSDLHREAISSSMKGLKRSAETRAKMSVARRARGSMSAEQRKLLSEVMSNLHAQGKIKNAWRGCSRTWFDSKSAGRVYLHSSYELKLAKWLDSHNVTWERCSRIFTYEFMGQIKRYTPDFYVPEAKLFIETKGYVIPRDLAKWSALASVEKLIVLTGERFSRTSDDVFLDVEELFS